MPFGSVITVVRPPPFGFAIDAEVAANGMLVYYLDTDDSEPFTCCFIHTLAGTTDKTIGGCLCYRGANWGPGSKTLAYADGIPDPNDPFGLLGAEIATIRSDGSNKHLLPRPNGTLHYFDYDPAWAPAGTWMVFGDPNGCRVTAEYRSDLFDETTIDRMLGHYLALLSGAVASPDTILDALPMIGPDAI